MSGNMKILAVDYVDVVNNNMEQRFKDHRPSEEQLRCLGPNSPVEVILRRYWLNIDSALATECMIKGFGTVVELGIIS